MPHRQLSNLDLPALRYFYCVATTRSFTEGARLAHVSGPAVSKSVKKLESLLHTQLLVRTSRHVGLTASGQVLLGHCERIFACLGDLARDLERPGTVAPGPLRIGTMEAFSSYALPRAAARLVAEHPGVLPQIHILSPERMQHMLLDGHLDLGLAIGSTPPAHVDAALLVESPGLVVCGRTHPLYAHHRVAPEALEDHPFVVPQFSERGHLPALDGFAAARRVGATVDLMDMAIQLVIEGAFLAYLPEVAVRCQLNHGEMRVVEGLPPGLPFELHALTVDPKPGVARLVEHLRQTLEESLSQSCEV